MAEAFRVARKIDRPHDEVWSALTNWDEAARWMSGVDTIRADGATSVGTKLTFVARGAERGAEIVALEPGKSVTIRSIQGSVRADYRYSVKEAEDGCEVALVATCETSGAMRLVAPLLRMAMKMTDRGQLDALADLVEGS